MIERRGLSPVVLGAFVSDTASVARSGGLEGRLSHWLSRSEVLSGLGLSHAIPGLINSGFLQVLPDVSRSGSPPGRAERLRK